MKKNLLIFCMATASSVFAQTQTPSSEWTTLQNTKFPNTSSGTRYMDAVSPSAVWAIGLDGTASSRNYNWFTVTGDGGTTFTSGNVFADTTTYVIDALEGIDANTAFVTGYYKATGNKGFIYKTTNAGVNWANVVSASMYTNSGSFANLTCFTDAQTGITQGDPVGGDFEIYRTTDGGANWTKVPGADIPNPVSQEYGLNNVYTKLGNHIWFGTNKARVYHSTDAGLTWTVSSTVPNAAQGINQLAFKDNMNGLCVGIGGTSTSPVFNLYSTTNGGLTWTQISSPANFGKNDMCVIPGAGKYASCGAGQGNTLLSYSSDDGVTWTDWGSTGIQYLQIDFVDNATGWAGTFSAGNDNNVGGIYKYSGVTTSLKPIAEISNFNIMANPSNGIVAVTVPKVKGTLSIDVIDALGKVVYKETTTSLVNGNSISLNLESLPKGLYTVSLTNGGETTFAKIVLQ